MKCPCCGAAELIRETRDIPYAYKGRTTTIPAVTGDFCPACGEVVLDSEQGDRYSEMMGRFMHGISPSVGDTYLDGG
jgi:HTH-type transcriptional regulator/antitoxin MqsA